MKRKTTAGIPAAARTAATGSIFPWPFKKYDHGADTHPWPLRLSIDAARGTSADTTDHANRIDGCATRRFIVHPYRSSRTAAVVELRAANQWINRVHRRKRFSCEHQARLQQALTRDGEKPKIVSCCGHGVPSPWLYVTVATSLPRPSHQIKYAESRKYCIRRYRKAIDIRAIWLSNVMWYCFLPPAYCLLGLPAQFLVAPQRQPLQRFYLFALADPGLRNGRVKSLDAFVVGFLIDRVGMTILAAVRE